MLKHGFCVTVWDDLTPIYDADYICICVDLPTEPTGKTPKVIGVDLGRRDIATTSTGKAWNGKQIESVRDRYSKVRAKV